MTKLWSKFQSGDKMHNVKRLLGRGRDSFDLLQGWGLLENNYNIIMEPRLAKKIGPSTGGALTL